MKLHEPFLISARLAPALRIGDATLSLVDTDTSASRDRAEFVLDLPDGTEYTDDNLRSGVQGFGGTVEQFETFLAFLSAAAEGLDFERRTGIKSDNADLFPPHIMQWASDHASDIECVQCDLTDQEGNVRAELIEE